MNKFQLKSQFSEAPQKLDFNIEHIQANVLGNECKFGVTKTYWLDVHKPIYIAFKLPNTLPMYNKTINVSIYLKGSICENMHINVAFST